MIKLAKDPAHNWLYASAPQKGLNNRTVSVPRGKVLGGSSAINGMIYIRGHRADYDAWAEAGCAGWGYDDVLPYFRKSECNSNAALDDAFHGRGGELSVADLRDPSPVDHDFISAAGNLQMRPCADFNAPEPEGMGFIRLRKRMVSAIRRRRRSCRPSPPARICTS